jgi:dihydropteroate synthase
LGIWKKDLSNRIDNAEFVWAKIARESGAVQLGGFAVRLVHDILALVAEACRLAILD